MIDIIERRGKEAFLDSLFVMEEGMRHYFSKAMQAKTNNMKPEIVDNYMQKAIDVAEKGGAVSPCPPQRGEAGRRSEQCSTVQGRCER